MNKQKLKPLVNNPDSWEPLKEFLEEELQSNSNSLINLEKHDDILRTQGYLRAVKKLLTLRDQVNERNSR